MVKQFEDMSNFEINRLVVEALFEEFESYEYQLQVCYLNKERERILFNPCENWSDAGSIIEDNGISLVYMPESGEQGAYYETHMLDEYSEEVYTTCDENPLKAAMITFLKSVEVYEMQNQSN